MFVEKESAKKNYATFCRAHFLFSVSMFDAQAMESVNMYTMSNTLGSICNSHAFYIITIIMGIIM